MTGSAHDLRYPHLPVFWFRLLRGVISFLVHLLTRFRIEGTEHIPPANQPVIFVSNHLHHLDAPAVGISLPRDRDIRALAAERYEQHLFFGLILKAAGSIFIQRGEVDRKALRQALNVLEDGKCMAIAVEGTRSKTGALAQGKTGAAYLATRANVPLVPLAVWGSEQILPAWMRLRRAEVIVRFGEPFYLPEGRARTAELDAHTEIIMTHIALLLPPEYRGVYAERAEQAANGMR